jgi:hypothetical protein
MAPQKQVYEAIKAWCDRERLNWRWITDYPQSLFDDVMLLRKIRKNFWYLFTPKQRALWNAVWGWTTKKQRRISTKNLNKLEKAIESAQQIQHTIKALRHQVTNRNKI